MVLLLAVTSNIFGAVFSRLGTATWITESMLALPLSPVMMLALVVLGPRSVNRSASIRTWS